MTDSENNNVRRLGKGDQKKELPAAKSLFPPEEDESNQLAEIPDSSHAEETRPTTLPPDLDLDALALPDTNQDALRSLATLPEGSVHPPVITPQGERYPPLAPQEPLATPATLLTQVPDEKVLRWRKLRYNLITVLGVLGTILLLAWYVEIWRNPQSTWNLLPPSTPFVIITATPGSGSAMPTPNEAGEIIIVVTDVQSPAATATDSPYPFIVLGSTIYAPNSNDLGCNWWSIAGTVTNRDGAPLNGYRVRVIGDDLMETVFSGAVLAFGPGGFELPLIGTPQEAEFTVQLFSPQDAPLSEAIPVVTRADCDGNVTIINFRQNR